MRTRLNQLLNEAVISTTEAEQVLRLVAEGQVTEKIALRVLIRIELMRSKSAKPRVGQRVVYVLGAPVTGSGRVVRNLSV